MTGTRRRAKPRRLRRRALTALRFEDLLRDEFAVAANVLDGTSSAGRRRIVSRCRRALLDPQVVRDVDARVALCRLLCAAAPECLPVLRELLRVGPGWWRYEVQFTLFCFLDQIPAIRRGAELASSVPGIVEAYLMEVQSESGRAAWMAAHMLANHWRPNAIGMGILFHVLESGRYVAGRLAALIALNGLARVARKAERATLTARINDTRSHDRSRLVRL